ncbi:MAG: enoyl-CoA hydratase-related protein, partial [Planctomycetota bacterium]
IALLGDIILAADTAKFCQSYSNVGIVPDGGGLYLLARIVGGQKAKEMVLLADVVNAQQAKELGIVREVYAAERLMAEAMKLAERLAAGPTRAFGLDKAMLNRGWAMDLESFLELEAVGEAYIMETADHREGVAAFKENVQRIASFIEKAREKGADLVGFPEMALMGSPAKDLLEHPGVIKDNLEALERLANGVAGVAALIGFVDTRSPKGGKPLYNAVAFIKDRKVFSVHHKFLLSTYDVFDEARYFESDPAVSILEFMGRKIGITLGEELLREAGPTRSLVAQGARMIINMAAFPYSFEEHKTRLKTLSQRASLYNTELVYVNMVG